jgi:ADP-ribose pyrophosphatase
VTSERASSPEPWDVRASEIVVSDRWVTVRADDCVDSRGRAITPYYVLEYSDWVSVLAIDTAGDAVVVEEYRHGAGIVAWGTIGGGVADGEDATDAAVRELREETGYEAASMIPLGWTWANFGNHTNRVHHFVALDCRPASDQALDDSEDIRVHVVPLAGIAERLHQSYHLLTWYKAEELLRSRTLTRPAG